MDNSINSDIIRGHIDTIILCALSNEDKNSQEILDYISVKSSDRYELKQATLYSSLKRLETDGFVLAQWKDSSDGGRRRVFHLTDKGRSLIEKNMNEWSFSRSIIDTLIDFKDPNLSPSSVGVAPSFGETDVLSVQKEQIVQGTIDFVNSPATSNEDDFSDASESSANEPDVPYTGFDATVKQQKKANKKIQKDVKKTDEITSGVNFRYILGGLLRSSQPSSLVSEEETAFPENATPSSDNVDTSVDAVSETPETVKDYSLDNEPIPDTKKRPVSFNSEINKTNTESFDTSDYTDVMDSCFEMNYRVRVAKQKRQAPVGILISPISAIASAVSFLLFGLEILFLTSNYPVVLPKFIPYTVFLFALFPAAMLLRLLINPKKTVYRHLAFKNVLLLSFIVYFDVCLLTLAVVFWAGVDITALTNILTYLVFPVFVYTDVFAYFIVRGALLSSSRFRVAKA